MKKASVISTSITTFFYLCCAGFVSKTTMTIISPLESSLYDNPQCWQLVVDLSSLDVYLIIWKSQCTSWERFRGFQTKTGIPMFVFLDPWIIVAELARLCLVTAYKVINYVLNGSLYFMFNSPYSLCINMLSHTSSYFLNR